MNTSSHSKLCSALGLSEEPFGVFYTDTQPENALMPQYCQSVAQQLQETKQVDMPSIRKSFACIFKFIWLARKKKATACFAADHFGCLGGSFFLGFHQPQLDFTANFISTGIPGSPVHGERYLDSPEKARSFFQAIDAGPAPAKYCVFKPISSFTAAETPMAVVFFGRFEVLSGLFTLATFVSDYGEDAVRIPFGSGCANIIAWTRLALKQGKSYAVVGGMDPSCRPYLKTDESTFTVPWDMYQQFLSRWQESFLCTDTWTTVQKKIERSNKAWQ